MKVPSLLREAGLRLVTLSEHYGTPRDEEVADEEWLEVAGVRGWVVFMKDSRIRYNRAERSAVTQHRVRAFCLSNQSLTADTMAARFLVNLAAIEAASIERGPFIYAVHQNRIERLLIGSG